MLGDEMTDERAWKMLLEDVKDMRRDVREIRKDMYALKTKVAIISSGFGASIALATMFIKQYFR